MSDEDLRLGKLALARGLVSKDQMREALDIQNRIQSEMGVTKQLGDILVEKNMVSAEGLAGLLSEQKKRTRKEIGGYELVSRLGAGGMGAVYKARQKSMDRLVALKVLQPRIAKNQEFISRFFREARAAGRLTHTNIVAGIDVGEADGFHYFAMEYVKGESVADRIEREGALPVEVALELAIQTARGLAYAHKHGIVHRDIKPDNIMITPDGTAKICDMGLARSTEGEDQTLTQTGMAVGTPHYIAPEQAKGERKLDARTDIYALGATICHMISGAPPFSGDSIAVILMKHMTEMPPLLDEVRPGVPHALAIVVQKMLEKDPDARYSSCEVLIEDLRAVRTGSAVSAPEPVIGFAPEVAPSASYRSAGAPPTGMHPPVPRAPVVSGEPAAPRPAALRPAVVAGVIVAAVGVLVIVLLSRRGPREEAPPKPPGPPEPDASPVVVEPTPEPTPTVQQPAPPSVEELVAKGFRAAEEYARNHPKDFERTIENFEDVRDMAKRKGVLEYAVKAHDAIARAEKLWDEHELAAYGALLKRAEKPGPQDRPADLIREFQAARGRARRPAVQERIAAAIERLRALRGPWVKKRFEGALAAAEARRFDEAYRLLEEGERDAPPDLRGRVDEVRRRIESIEGEEAVRARHEREAALEAVREAWEKAMARGDLAAAKDALARARKMLGGEPEEGYEDAKRLTECCDAFARAVVEGVKNKKGQVQTLTGIRGRIGEYDEAGERIELSLSGAGSMYVPLARLSVEERLRMADCADPAKTPGALALAAAAFLLFEGEQPNVGRVKLYLAAAERGEKDVGFLERRLGGPEHGEPGDRPHEVRGPHEPPEREMHFNFENAGNGAEFQRTFEFFRRGRGRSGGKIGPGGMQIPLDAGQWVFVIARDAWFGNEFESEAMFEVKRGDGELDFGFLLAGTPEKPELLLQIHYSPAQRRAGTWLAWHEGGRITRRLAANWDDELYNPEGRYVLRVEKHGAHLRAELNGRELFARDLDGRDENRVRHERLGLFVYAKPGGGECEISLREVHVMWPPGGEIKPPTGKKPGPHPYEPREPHEPYDPYKPRLPTDRRPFRPHPPPQ